MAATAAPVDSRARLVEFTFGSRSDIYFDQLLRG